MIYNYLYDDITSNLIQQSKLYVELEVPLIALQILCHGFSLFML